MKGPFNVNDVDALFGKSRAEGRAALVAYLPAGFPSYDGCLAAVRSLVDAGVDLIEIGLPYSDPVLDGATIQEAADVARRGGIRTAGVLNTVEAVTSAGAAAVVMTYWNPVLRYGVERFARDLAAAGGSGLITPDLTPENAAGWIAASDDCGLSRVFLVAPSSSDARIASTAAACRGFVYATSVMGVTGARSSVGAAAPELVMRVRVVTDLPVGVGLGVSTAAQAGEVAAYADAVIVGSAFCRLLLDAPDTSAGLAAIHILASGMRASLTR